MALPDELIKLIKAEVARQLTHADRLKIGCIEGKGGNTIITSNGDILLRTLAGKKAYYNGTEIGTASGGSYLPLAGGTMTGDITMSLAKQLKLNNVSNTLVGKVFGTSATVEAVTYNGLQLQPQNTVGTSPGNIYIGDYNAAPSGVGIKVMDTRMDIASVAGTSINFYSGTTQIASMSASTVSFLKPLAMNSQKITGLAAGTVNGDAVRYEQIAPSISEGASVVTCVKDFDVKHSSNPGIAYRIADGTQKAVSYYNVSTAEYIFSTGATTIPYSFQVNAVEKFNIANDGLRAKHAIFFRKNHSADDCYILDDANGTMELHVPSGQKLKVVVG